jgi:hypothetical protein
MLRVPSEEFVPRHVAQLPVVFSNPEVNYGFHSQPVYETGTIVWWCPPSVWFSRRCTPARVSNKLNK